MNVEVIGKEKLGGGYVIVIICGDVVVVLVVIESGKVWVELLGKLIVFYVIMWLSVVVFLFFLMND